MFEIKGTRWRSGLVQTYFIATNTYICNGVGPEVHPTLVTALPLQNDINNRNHMMMTFQ